MATKGIVRGIVSNLVTVEVDGPVSQNEICYISVGGVKLMAEVIKVIGKNAFVQVFESTRGMRVGDSAEFQGHMLEVTLGPGMLSRNYDGLQNDLDKMEGVFLKRGEYTFPLDENKKWAFVSDYVRLYALYNHGGIYMDTDVQVLKPLDAFLNDQAFSGFEAYDRVPTGIMGAEKEHHFFKKLLDYYTVTSYRHSCR